MSVYNGEAFLHQAIESILNQSYTNFDFVIYDDCSTDSTPEIIKSYNDPRIIYRRNKSNQGLTKNLADGVTKAHTDYIARMDADDIAYHERLEKQILWMDAHPKISIMGTPVTYFHEVPGDGGLAQQPIDDITIKATLFVSFSLMHPSIIIRTKDLLDNGINYNTDFRYSQDHSLYFDCITKGLKFANYHAPLLHMRSHHGSISRATHEAQQECSQRARANFLKVTGLGEKCNEEEIKIYTALASGQFPKTKGEIQAYENFVFKIYENQNTVNYFDKELLKQFLASILCDQAYHAVDKRGQKKAALLARKSRLEKFCNNWPIKLKIKFLFKLIFKKL